VCGDERVEIGGAVGTVKVFARGKRVASHRRALRTSMAVMMPKHMPNEHQEQATWTPERNERRATKPDPNLAKLAQLVMGSSEHPQQGFKACLGTIRLGSRHGTAHLDRACARALALGGACYSSVASILDRGLEDKPLPEVELARSAVVNEKIGGGEFLASEEVASCSPVQPWESFTTSNSGAWQRPWKSSST